ncbi:MAG: hypothetical protein KAV82_07575 [Phycisphaerae bacterium]|nr:hypothetical protein [Phycisphaerae bacterium]
MYRNIATSEAGFVQQLAVGYVNHGYWFYVTGCVPDHKQPELIDQKLVEKYDIAVSKWTRARRKRQGLANVHYLRHEEFFVLIATKGVHPLFEEERTVIRDVRREPIRFAGYSIGYKQGCDGKWHPSVRIHPVEYKLLKDYCMELATHRSASLLAEEFRRLRFEPYAPVRRQLLNILRAVNRARRKAGFTPLPFTALRLRRRIVRPLVESRHDAPIPRFPTRSEANQLAALPL